SRPDPANACCSWTRRPRRGARNRRKNQSDLEPTIWRATDGRQRRAHGMSVSDKPRADLASMILLAPRRWAYETSDDAMRFILLDGYFDPVFGLRAHDRIDVICLAEEPAAHVFLVVDKIQPTELDKVVVSPL